MKFIWHRSIKITRIWSLQCSLLAVQSTTALMFSNNGLLEVLYISFLRSIQVFYVQSSSRLFYGFTILSVVVVSTYFAVFVNLPARWSSIQMSRLSSKNRIRMSILCQENLPRASQEGTLTLIICKNVFLLCSVIYTFTCFLLQFCHVTVKGLRRHDVLSEKMSCIQYFCSHSS